MRDLWVPGEHEVLLGDATERHEQSVLRGQDDHAGASENVAATSPGTPVLAGVGVIAAPGADPAAVAGTALTPAP